MHATGVSLAAIVDSADSVAEKIDMLLDRAVDTVMGAPTPGSRQWRQGWETRGSAAGYAALEQRMLVKIAIAQRAGVDPRHEIDRARQAGGVVDSNCRRHGNEPVACAAARRRRRRSSTDGWSAARDLVGVHYQ